MPENSQARSPRLVSGTDIRSLPIGPQEAFVLSCIDGVNSEDELASITGFALDAIARIIRRLVALRAIEFVPVSPQKPLTRGSAAPQQASGSYRLGPIHEIQSTFPSQAPAVYGGSSSSKPAPPVSGQYDLKSLSNVPSASQPQALGDDAVRRKAFARKLSYSSFPPISRSSESVSPSAARSLTPSRLLQQDLAAQARQQQLSHYVALAEEASAHSDLDSAVNSFKIACSIAPDDEALAARLRDVQIRAAANKWQDYAERAEFEVYDRQFGEAARLYELAALGHPCWRFFERAAFYLLHSDGDLKKAAELAKRAVSLGSEVAKCRVTLARIYAAAKLKESAIAELERAIALDPKQEATLRDYMRQVKRGGV